MSNLEEQVGNFFCTKEDMYQFMDKRAKILLGSEKDWLANLANTSALIFMFLKNINWVGFYLKKGNDLVLGPFQGKPACPRIPEGKGVCGTAATKKETIVVPDVNRFPGHIACDQASRSEIVIPLIKGGEVMAVLDIDSPVKDRFDAEDVRGLEKIVQGIMELIEWNRIE